MISKALEQILPYIPFCNMLVQSGMDGGISLSRCHKFHTTNQEGAMLRFQEVTAERSKLKKKGAGEAKGQPMVLTTRHVLIRELVGFVPLPGGKTKFEYVPEKDGTPSHWHARLFDACDVHLRGPEWDATFTEAEKKTGVELEAVEGRVEIKARIVSWAYPAYDAQGEIVTDSNGDPVVDRPCNEGAMEYLYLNVFEVPEGTKPTADIVPWQGGKGQEPTRTTAHYGPAMKAVSVYLREHR